MVKLSKYLQQGTAFDMNFLNDLNRALELHKLGRLAEAKAIYQEVLVCDPRNADANHLMGALYHAEKNYLKALSLVNQAIDVIKTAQYLNTRGMIFVDMGRPNEAISDLSAALKLDPQMPEPHNNLSIAYRQIKNLKKSIWHAKKATELRPKFVEGWLSLGAAYQDQDDFILARECYETAKSIDPHSIIAKINLAKLEYNFRDYDSAFSKFTEIDSQYPIEIDVAFPFARILIEKDRLPEASDVLVRGFQNTKDTKVLGNLVSQDEFFNILHKVCAYQSDVLGKKELSIELYCKAIESAPKIAHLAWVNVAKAYFDIHQLPLAIESTKKALDSRGSNPYSKCMALNNLGVFYMAEGDSLKAIDSFESVLKIIPDHIMALGWLVKEKAHICDWKYYRERCQQLDAARFTDNRSSIAPFTPLAVYNDPAALLYWSTLSSNELFNATASQVSNINLSLGSQTRQEKKIRVGYYSFDFRNHPVAHLTARLFELHDKERFEIYAYSYGPDDNSQVRHRIKECVDSFVDVKDLSVFDTAKRISEDSLDILIDLTGNTQHNRCQVFALRPAKIQAHWLGFIGTMGSAYYDYIIADEFVIPYGEEEFFAENILRLPYGFHIADDSRVIDASKQTRHKNGLPDDVFVFGCFCQTFKIQPEMFESWMQILSKVPNSVLWVASGPKYAVDNLKKTAEERGVDPARIIVAERCGMEEYLTRFSLIDLHLDTFPYTSGTVASDALFGGCPLLTLTGKTMVSRMAGSIMTYAGFPELVAVSSIDYVQKAVELAKNRPLLDSIKTKLLQKRHSNELLNTKKITQGLEQMLTNVIESNR